MIASLQRNACIASICPDKLRECEPFDHIAEGETSSHWTASTATHVISRQRRSEQAIEWPCAHTLYPQSSRVGPTSQKAGLASEGALRD